MKALLPRPDLEQDLGFSALHKAAIGMEVDSIENLLISDPLLIENADFCGWTALHWAAHRGNEDILRSFVAQKADCNKLTMNGSSPLHQAAWSGTLGCVQVLLGAGAEPSTGNPLGYTALHFVSTPRGRSLPESTLKAAALLDAGSNVNATTLEGITPLHQATDVGIPEIVETLISRGADISASTKTGSNALSIAVQEHRNPNLSILLQHGADHEGPVEHYKSFTHLVADCADVESLRLLVAHPLKPRDINMKDKQGLTAIQIGLERKDVDAEWRDLFMQFLKSVDKDTVRPQRQPRMTTAERYREERQASVSIGENSNTTEEAALDAQPEDGSDESDAEFADAVQQLADLNIETENSP